MQKRIFTTIIGLSIVISILALTYIISHLLGLSPKLQIWLTGIPGLVAFLGALAEITGYNIKELCNKFASKPVISPSSSVENNFLMSSNLITERKLGLPLKPYTNFVGREEQLVEVMEILSDSSGMPIISITGIGGIGKTSLAYEIAERSLKQQLFSNVFWLSAKQEIFIDRHIEIVGNSISAYDDVMNHIYEKLTGKTVTSKYDRDVELFALLKNQPYLIVLDNLETLHDEVSLLSSLPKYLHPSRVLYTSRSRSELTDNIYTVTVSGLSEANSLELIRHEASIRGLRALQSARDSVLRQIHAETGGMPLAIRLVVGEILAGLTIEAVLERLQLTTSEEELYRFIYFDLWKTLSEAARIILVSMPAFAGSANKKILFEVSKLSTTDFDNAIMELVNKSLIEVNNGITNVQRKYSIHPLTRNFVISDLPKIFDKR